LRREFGSTHFDSLTSLNSNTESAQQATEINVPGTSRSRRQVLEDIEEENRKILENRKGKKNHPFNWGEIGN
jgi:hypothetical protein